MRTTMFFLLIVEIISKKNLYYLHDSIALISSINTDRKGRFGRKPNNTRHGREHLCKYHLMSFAE